MTREEKKEYNKQYRLKNKEKVGEQQQKWYDNNKDKKKEYNQQYRLKNKEKIAAQRQRYRIKNEDKIQQYYSDNKDKILERGKQYYSDNKEMVLGKQKKYRENNKEKIRKRDWLYNLKRYGITKKEYLEMFNEQNGCCKICKTHQSKLKSGLHIDHNHNTGKIRGLLCSKCNQALGLLNEDVSLLTDSLKYLENNS